MEHPHLGLHRIKLVKGGRTIEGELVVETILAWQVAVDGEVGVYQKNEWSEASFNFGDILGMFGMSR